ncbi:MAG: hypothetical protein HYV36_00840 [Lentisphaerae bacterium]|nr:hypothetical protein [Lentisphaerota bacterium]
MLSTRNNGGFQPWPRFAFNHWEQKIVWPILALGMAAAVFLVPRTAAAAEPEGTVWTKYNNTTSSPSDTTSTDGRIPLGTAGKGDAVYAYYLSVIKDGATYKIWYSGYDGTNIRLYYATSPDGLTWTKYTNAIPANSNSPTA